MATLAWACEGNLGMSSEKTDVQVWQERAEAAKREAAAARKYAAEMREFCSPHGVSVHYADQLIEVMDRAREGRT